MREVLRTIAQAVLLCAAVLLLSPVPEWAPAKGMRSCATTITAANEGTAQALCAKADSRTKTGFAAPTSDSTGCVYIVVVDSRDGTKSSSQCMNHPDIFPIRSTRGTVDLGADLLVWGDGACIAGTCEVRVFWADYKSK